MQDKYNVKFNQLAVKNIDSAFAYISKMLHNPKAAIDLINKIENYVENASLYPHSMPFTDNKFFKKETFRRIIVDNYILLYTIQEEQKQITIVNFIYGKRDTTKL